MLSGEAVNDAVVGRQHATVPLEEANWNGGDGGRVDCVCCWVEDGNGCGGSRDAVDQAIGRQHAASPLVKAESRARDPAQVRWVQAAQVLAKRGDARVLAGNEGAVCFNLTRLLLEHAQHVQTIHEHGLCQGV